MGFFGKFGCVIWEMSIHCYVNCKWGLCLYHGNFVLVVGFFFIFLGL